MTELEKKISYRFVDRKLLERALTHKSFANELRGRVEHNEKLEFIGDAVIDLLLGEMLFFQFPNDTEGNLSKKRASLVNEDVLSQQAKTLNLSKHLKLGRGEISTGGSEKPRLLASTFEALIGAVYLDSGIEEAKKIVFELFQESMAQFQDQADYALDFKTRLQELVQAKLKQTPYYELIKEEGPAHQKIFYVAVKISDQILGEGQGVNKKAAEQKAAENALEKIEVKNV